MACKMHGFFAVALLAGLSIGMHGAAQAPSMRKSAGFLPVAVPLPAEQPVPVPQGLTPVAAGESSAQPMEPVVDISKTDAVWRLSPAQRAVLREQVRRSATRSARCPQCRPE